MPHEIRVDNFHGPLHILPPGEQHQPEMIAERSMGSVRDIIRRHVQRQQTVVFEELLGEPR